MRHSSLLLIALAVAACDDGGTAAIAEDQSPPIVDSTPPDAMADADLPDQTPPDAEPPDAAPDAELPDAVPDAAPDMPLDPCGAADPDDPIRLAPNTPFEGEICRDRAAWFRVDVPADNEVSLTLRFQHRIGDLELAAYRDGEVREQIAESTSATDVERIAIPAAPEPQAILVEVYGYRRAVGQYVLEARLFDDATALATRVTGTVQYEDKRFDANGFTGELVDTAAQGVRVEVVRVADGAVVGDGWTDAEGAFALDLRAQPGEHRVRAVSAGRIGGQFVEVRDIDANLRYGVESAPFAAGETVEGVELRAAARDAIGGALNIVDNANRAFVFYAPFVDGPAPPLTYRWQPGVPHGCGSCYSNNTVRLAGAVEDTDEYDDVIVLHELWHWFMEHYSADDSPGGSHRDRLVSPVLAFGEGVAYAFAGLVRGSPEIIDTFIDDTRHIDMEAMTQGGADLDVLYGTADGTPSGAHREELVEGIIWDSIDGPSPDEPFDQVAVGLEGGFELLRRLGLRRFIDVGARGIDVSDWLNMLQCDDHAAAELAEERDYPFAAGDAVCEKGHEPAPMHIERVGDRLWLSSKTPVPLIVRRGTPATWKPTTLTCVGRCELGLADANAAVVVSAPGQPWAGVSWMGAQLRARLAGPVRAGVRTFQSAPR